MLLINVYKKSPWRVSVVVLHVDYHKWPARSWSVLETETAIDAGWSARQVAAVVGDRISRLCAVPADAPVDVFVYDEQLELPLELPRRRTGPGRPVEPR